MRPIWEWLEKMAYEEAFASAMCVARSKHPERADEIILAGFKAVLEQRNELRNAVYECKILHIPPIEVVMKQKPKPKLDLPQF